MTAIALLSAVVAPRGVLRFIRVSAYLAGRHHYRYYEHNLQEISIGMLELVYTRDFRMPVFYSGFLEEGGISTTRT